MVDDSISSRPWVSLYAYCNTPASKWHSHNYHDSFEADIKGDRVSVDSIPGNLHPLPKIEISHPCKDWQLHILGLSLSAMAHTLSVGCISSWINLLSFQYGLLLNYLLCEAKTLHSLSGHPRDSHETWDVNIFLCSSFISCNITTSVELIPKGKDMWFI